MATLRLVLGDQLSRDLSALSDWQPGDVILMAEVQEEATTVRHHQRKIAFLFAAMRHYAQDQRERGRKVDYVALDDPDNSGSFAGEVKRALTRHAVDAVVLTEPGEWRVLRLFETLREEIGCDLEIRDDDRFLCSHGAFASFAEGAKELRQEVFYRQMRKSTGYLMDGKEPSPGPVEGKWNFDHDNREPLKAKIVAPARPTYAVDETTQDVLDLVASRFGNHFGSLVDFDYPVTRRQSLHYLGWFIQTALPDFGTYQDAMRQGAPLLFHSHLSGLINCGLLDPRECCERAEAAFRSGNVPINAVEGFIRQIIGWREFIRGIYWAAHARLRRVERAHGATQAAGFLLDRRDRPQLPEAVLREVREGAYNHHIQRLMVIGNFCLLCGFNPREVQEWYLVVYHDAYEWVEMPNVVGMILYADGGLFATKPYAASGNYIDRMSDYCADCAYSPKLKSGEGACPFNFLYWDFIARNEARLKGNPRLNRTYATLERMADEKVVAARKDAAHFLDGLVATGDY